MTPPARRGYSLIELVVVVAILGVLVGMVTAAVGRVRLAAGRADCQNRLRQQALAVLNYEAANGRLPPGSVQGPYPPLGVPDGAGHGLWAFVLPHLDQGPVAARYRFDRPCDHPENAPAAAARIAVLECPLAPSEGRPAPWPGVPGTAGACDYGPIDVNPFLADIGVLDPAASFAGPLPVNAQVKLVEITDGASNTVLIAEAGRRPGMPWCSPDVPVSVRDVLGGPHAGSNAAMADGSVRLFRDGTDIRLLGRLATRSGGEAVELD